MLKAGSSGSRPEPLARFGKRHAPLNLDSHRRVGRDLLRHEGQGLLSKTLGQHNDTVCVSDQIIPGVDCDVLSVVGDLNGLVDGDNLEQRARRCGPYVTGEDLLFLFSFVL
jgi:hypothetical protein